MLKKLIDNKQGNFAMLFALTLFPLIGGVGMAIDYSSLSNYRAKLQNATDAGVLFAGRYYEQNSRFPSNIEVEDFVASNFTLPLTSVVLNQNLTASPPVLDLEVKGTAPAYFFGSIYPDVFDQQVNATVPIGGDSYIEVAMVLDTTYSMSADGKLDSLKSVSADFIDDLDGMRNAKTTIKMGIVPFANHVNVGMSNRSASWIDVPADVSSSREVCRFPFVPGSRTCTTETRYADGVPYEARVCTGGERSDVKVCTTVTDSEQWYGCVGSRNAPNTYVDGNYSVRVPGLIAGDNWHCPSALTPLTENVTTLNTAISNFVARGDTFIAPGVMWGVKLLSADAPFTEAKAHGSLPAATTHKKIMVLMTDGDNSHGADVPWNPANWSGDVAAANADTLTACQYARDNNITIYSIAFGTSVSTAGENVMKTCADHDSRYFSAKDAGALEDAFKSIASEIISLRLSS